MSPSPISRTVLPAIAFLALSVSAASAQAADPERALQMQEKAAEIEQLMYENGPTRAARLEAARFHLEAASARAVNDPQAITDLVTAARHVGELDPERSAAILNRAAEAALAIGDVESAAHAYIDAAIVLKESRSVFTQTEGSRISAWHHKASLLSNSPLLNAGQRSRIVDRLFPSVSNAY